MCGISQKGHLVEDLPGVQRSQSFEVVLLAIESIVCVHLLSVKCLVVVQRSTAPDDENQPAHLHIYRLSWSLPKHAIVQAGLLVRCDVHSACSVAFERPPDLQNSIFSHRTRSCEAEHHSLFDDSFIEDAALLGQHNKLFLLQVTR